jgi:8-oxo-dGTP diphosphatase
VSPADPVQVVGAAIVRDDRVLVARRTTPPAGRWEFPGGKVEPGETPERALVREVEEELGCRVEVRGWLGGASPIGTTHLLRVAVATLTEEEPRPGADHDELRWLAAGELNVLDWLAPDRPFLAELADLLGGGRRHLLGSET